MPEIGLCGPAYRAQSVNANAQVLRNLYIEPDESGSGKTQWSMWNTPGTSLFSFFLKADGSEQPYVRSVYNANERCFVVAGESLYEVFADGTNTLLGDVGDDGKPASFANSATQLAIVSNGQLSVYDLNSATFSHPTTHLGPVKMTGYVDGYFVLLISNSQKFQISGLLDATSWDALDVTQVSVFPDNVLSMMVDHRQIILFGVTKSVMYNNTGAADFPFSPILPSYMEQGIGADWARDRADNSVFWVGADDRGHLIANRLNGYTPARISNFAIENEWQSYRNPSDAVSYAYQEAGHTFWVVNFITAKKTWVYDCSLQNGIGWHERDYLNPVTGETEAQLGRCHTFVFGKHLIGSRANCFLYVSKIEFVDDDGQPIQRLRRFPHIAQEQRRLFYSQLQLDVEVGLSAYGSQSSGATLSVVAEPFPITTGDVYAVVVGTKADGTRLVSPLLGPVNIPDLTSSPEVYFPLVPGVINWRAYFATGTSVPAKGMLVTEAGVATFLSPARSIPWSSLIVGASNSLVRYATPIASLSQLIPDVNHNPTVWLRWSDDGGHEWSNQHQMNVGKIGQYKYRCIYRRMGQSRDRVFEISCSDTIPWRFSGAYMNNNQ